MDEGRVGRKPLIVFRSLDRTLVHISTDRQTDGRRKRGGKIHIYIYIFIFINDNNTIRICTRIHTHYQYGSIGTNAKSIFAPFDVSTSPPFPFSPLPTVPPFPNDRQTLKRGIPSTNDRHKPPKWSIIKRSERGNRHWVREAGQPPFQRGICYYYYYYYYYYHHHHFYDDGTVSTFPSNCSPGRGDGVERKKKKKQRIRL